MPTFPFRLAAIRAPNNGIDAHFLNGASKCQSNGSVSRLTRKGRPDDDYNNWLVSIDLTKEMFQIHGVDGNGKRVLRKQLRRTRWEIIV
ncbi:MAG: hypothetical protein CVU29_04640 [Betaproteobacteria bacterium HGW-Betaproteobacteria-22]|nr:MAG: hypothetical protein CVU29_04640 [Betaproteobacteria bacterium HGW-Betaproteobacteria-22]